MAISNSIGVPKNVIAGKIDASEKGAANGVAALDENGKVLATQISDKVDTQNIGTETTQGFGYNGEVSTTQYTTEGTGHSAINTGYDLLTSDIERELYTENSVTDLSTHTGSRIILTKNTAYLNKGETLALDREHELLNRSEVPLEVAPIKRIPETQGYIEISIDEANMFELILEGDVTNLTIKPPVVNGMRKTVIITQDDSGWHTVNWETFKFPGGFQIPLSMQEHSTTIVTFITVNGVGYIENFVYGYNTEI